MNISAADFTLGIFDQDSAGPGNQVASFTVNGIDLTSLLNTAFEAHGGANSEYDVYSVAPPTAAFGSLSSRTAAFALTWQGPGLGVLGPTSFNGAALDFSTPEHHDRDNHSRTRLGGSDVWRIADCGTWVETAPEDRGYVDSLRATMSVKCRPRLFFTPMLSVCTGPCPRDPRTIVHVQT